MSNRSTTPYVGQSIVHNGTRRFVTSVLFMHASKGGRIVTTATVILDHVVQYRQEV